MSDKVLFLTTKWWFYAIVLVLNFTIPPIATLNFSLQNWGDIISHTLRYSISVTSWTPIKIPFQILFILLMLTLIISRGKFSRLFAGFITLNYTIITIGQNVAFTEKFGLSIVTINLLMFLLVALSWLAEMRKPKNSYTFSNWNIKYIWMVVLSLAAFWHPIDYAGIPSIDVNPNYFLTGGSSLTFCLTTPLLLTIMTLNLPNVNLLTYRISALIGTIIGIYNMMCFFMPYVFWIGVLHVPLLVISVYSLILSFRIENITNKLTTAN